MEFLGAIIAAAVLSSTPVVTPTGVELERLVDTNDHFPGNGSPVFFDGQAPVPCGSGVALRALADDPQAWIYYATNDGPVQVVADEETPIPGVGAPFDFILRFSCLGGDRLLFIGARTTAPPFVPGSAFVWSPTEGLEVFDFGGGSVDGVALADYSFAGGDTNAVGLRALLDPVFSGNALVFKEFGMPAVFVADDQIILPGQTDPVSVFSFPDVFEGDLVFIARVNFVNRMYRWSESSGFSVLVDEMTPVPGLPETFATINNLTVLSDGIAFTGLYSAGAGIFHYGPDGVIEPLVVPGDMTVNGETVLTAFTPQGETQLFAFRGRTVETDPWESLFARAPDGSIHRILGVTEQLEGRTVIQVDGEADRDTVAVRTTVSGEHLETVYTAQFQTATTVADIPMLSVRAGLVLALLLAGTGSILLWKS